ncbi:MAG: MFS transporter [Lachnospiraceae bacterium]|nr:MFS transporter [Lachnospiraceae bacterium]
MRNHFQVAKLRRRVIFCFSFLMAVSFYTPVFASFFQVAHKFTNSQITILFACYSLSTFIFEIPTGLLGDKVGERESLIIGSGLIIISTSLFIFGNTPLLYVGEIIFGIGSTFFSGPFEALVYQYCKSSEDETNYSKIVSRTYSLQWLALCFSFIGCFFLSKFGNVTVPFYATLGSNILTFIAAFLYPKSRKTGTKNQTPFFVYLFTKLQRTESSVKIAFLMLSFPCFWYAGINSCSLT